MNKGKKVVVTGGSGFLGGRLLRALRSAPFFCQELEIIATKNKSALGVEGITLLDSELEDIGSLLEDAETLIHCATCYGRAGESEEEVFATNLGFPTRLIEKMKKINLILNVDTSLPADVSVYSRSKQQFRDHLKQLRNVRVLNVKLEHIYGSGASYSNFVSRVAKTLLLRDQSMPMSHGLQKRDFIHVDDATQAILALITNYQHFDESFVDVPLGSGNSIQIKSFVELMAEIAGGGGDLFAWGQIPLRKNEPMDLCADLTILSNLGWNPKIDLRIGLERLISYEREKL